MRLYEKLEGGRSFPTAGEMYRELGLYDLTQEASYRFFARHGVGGRFVREFSDGVPRSNYGQDGRMNAWATLVSLIGGGVAGGRLFSEQEGNVRIVLILTRERPDIPFSAIGWLGPAAGDDRRVGGRGVYKVFSSRPLDDALLDRLFADRAETARLVWDAYPVLTPAQAWPPFRLAHGLYYVNAMESAVSAMETEAMAARNIVNLLAQDLAENGR